MKVLQFWLFRPTILSAWNFNWCAEKRGLNLSVWLAKFNLINMNSRKMQKSPPVETEMRMGDIVNMEELITKKKTFQPCRD